MKTKTIYVVTSSVGIFHTTDKSLLTEVKKITSGLISAQEFENWFESIEELKSLIPTMQEEQKINNIQAQIGEENFMFLKEYFSKKLSEENNAILKENAVNLFPKYLSYRVVNQVIARIMNLPRGRHSNVEIDAFSNYTIEEVMTAIKDFGLHECKKIRNVGSSSIQEIRNFAKKIEFDLEWRED